MGFADDIAKFKEKALLAANQSVSNATESLFTEVVVRSPSPSNPSSHYSQGNLANQWYTLAGGGFSGEVSTSTNPSGADSLSRIKATLAQKIFLGKDNSITLTNNSPWAYRSEYLGWKTSDNPIWKNAPAYHMVSISTMNFKGAYS